MAEIVWHEEIRSVSQLEDHPQNPRLFTERGMDQLTESIRKIGYASPININLNNRILSGHARKKVLLAAGLNEVKVWVPNRELTADEEREVLLRMNKNIAGEFDFEILANEFEISELQEIGFTDYDLHIDSGDPSGKEYDESIEDGVARETAYKVRIPIMDADKFEEDLTSILRKYPKARMEKNV